MKQQELGMSSNAQPLVTIGIPTYNRPHFLKESLASALNQNYQNIEVVVSDNSENDDSRKVVEEIGDPRVKYSRNERNMGANYNWMRCLEMASGEYLGWLQDDDLLMRDFVSRGIRVFLNSTNISAFYSSSVWCPSPTVRFNSPIMGPLVPLDWQNATGAVCSRHLVIPLSLFQSIAIFPACLFRKKVFNSVFINLIDWEKKPLFVERLFFIEAAKHGDFYADAYIGALFRKHENQTSWKLSRESKNIKRDFDFLLFSIEQMDICKECDLSFFSQLLKQYPDEYLLNMADEVNTILPKTNSKYTFYQPILDILFYECNKRGLRFRERSLWIKSTFNLVRSITPPILYSFARKILKKG